MTILQKASNYGTQLTKIRGEIEEIKILVMNYGLN